MAVSEAKRMLDYSMHAVELSGMLVTDGLYVKSETSYLLSSAACKQLSARIHLPTGLQASINHSLISSVMNLSRRETRDSRA